jgi:hypothetical protein
MYLWDYEMGPMKERIDALGGIPRLKIAVNALSWTMSTMNPPIENAEVVQFVNDVLEYCGNALRQGDAGPEFIEELDERHDALLDEEIAEPGVDSILAAVSGCFGYEEAELRTQAVYDLLSSCYEAILLRIAPGLVTIEFERESARCNEVIEFQKNLVLQAGDL